MSNKKLNPVASEPPLVPANQCLPEITLKVIIIGTLLTIVLAAANAYLGLKVGQTISASIPAAIISMSILRFFRHSNVLENVMVQTMASVGEALIAGVTFILPALVILHTWDHFYYWQTVIIALLGGTLGVLFTIPLRRALLTDSTLRYPEGIAISNVFKASMTKEKADVKILSIGGLVGGLISFCQTGFQIITDHFYYWIRTSHTIFGFGLGLSPALIAAGYIVGINVSISMMVGVAIGWVIGIPAITAIVGLPNIGSATDIAIDIWHGHTRYIGVGTMIVGGLWTLVTLFNPIKNSLVASMASLKAAKKGITNTTLRTERDIPISYVLGGSLLLLIPIFILIYSSIIPADSAISQNFRAVLAGFGTIYILVAGFVFCSVASYFAGLIGSTNTPGSGLLVSALLILCLIFLAFFTLNGGMNGRETLGVILGVGCTVVIGAGVVIANDTMQDLKVGEVVGATPWKQQVMLILGTIVAAFVMPPILELLYQAYGIGGAFPRPGMNHAQMLAAPQAGLMAAVAQGVYTHNLPWLEIGFGALIAVVCIFIDEFLKRRGTRLPVLAVGVGIYLPLDASIPVIIGGLLSYIIQLRLDKRYPLTATTSREIQTAPHKHRGLLLACGIVAGASVMGVILAIPFALEQSSDALKIMPDQYESLAGILGLIVTFILCAWIYKVVMKKS